MLIFFVVILMVGCTEEQKESLQMVHLVYRHGARSPTNFYPTNPYQASFWPDGPGMLTQIGMNMEYDLGLFLKKRYITESKLVNSSYIHKEVYIRSSNSPRCLQSAECQLAGLYPPHGRQIWNTAIPWQPIPVYTVPKDQDPVLRPDDDNCPRLHQLWNQQKDAPEYKQKEIDHQGLFNYLSNYTGMKVNLHNIGHIQGDFICEETAHLKIPNWVTKDVRKELFEVTEWIALNEYRGDDEFGRLTGGTLLGMINDNMNQYRAEKDIRDLYKLNIFSGHDTSLLALTAALDIDMTSSPTFSACIMVELYKNTDGEYHVQLHYRNDTTGSTYHLKLKKCDFRCPLDVFTNLLKNRISKDRSKECGLKTKASTSFNDFKFKVLSGVFVGISVLLSLINIILLLYMCKKSRRRQFVDYNNDDDDDLDNYADNANLISS